MLEIPKPVLDAGLQEGAQEGAGDLQAEGSTLSFPLLYALYLQALMLPGQLGDSVAAAPQLAPPGFPESIASLPVVLQQLPA
mmetsp:Transcript_121607/g.221171  ORF Transcript_121607/g.221171 Transcript_121607/m.221171 type:complete len:82 (+) Transcript_121607:183-428(+)